MAILEMVLAGIIINQVLNKNYWVLALVLLFLFI